MRRWSFFSGLIALVAGSLASPATAQQLDKISIVIFGAPSLGAFLPPIIKQHKLDEKHGLSIDFQERTPDAYTAQFNSGEFQLGGSAAVLTVGLADLRGVKVTYLFNLFDFWGAVVTTRANVQSLKDLEGKELAAARGTTNFVMFDWLARQQGVDIPSVKVINTATPGLVGYALAERADAVQLWEPAYTSLRSKKPGIRTLDLKIKDSWQKFAGSQAIPYLGVAAHTSWVEKNPQLVGKLHAAYKDAAEWIVAHPDEAAILISPRGSEDDQKAIAETIKANDRLGLNMRWASEMRKEIGSVYAAAKSIGFFTADPSPATIYEWKGQ